jgi:MoxR-like ATPase
LPNKKKETVIPSRGFSVIATMNGTPDMLPEALADRFGVKININSVHPDAIKSLPEKYRTVYSERDENNIPPSIRSWKEFSKLVDAGVDLRSSATVCFGNDYAEDVVEAIELQDV